MLTHSLVAVVGVWLGVRLLVALYRWLDLCHTIGRDWPRAARGTVLTVTLIAVIAVLLPAAYRGTLLAGIAGYVAFYLAAATGLAYATRRMMSR
jgi:hypothetical protein